MVASKSRKEENDEESRVGSRSSSSRGVVGVPERMARSGEWDFVDGLIHEILHQSSRRISSPRVPPPCA